MAGTSMGKIARHWGEREKRSHSLTEVLNRLTQKFAARIEQPKKERANRIDILIGESGIGKSTILGALPDKLARTTKKEWKAKLWHVGGQAFEDVTGLPIIKEDVVLADGSIMSRDEYNSAMAVAQKDPDPKKMQAAVAGLQVSETHRRATFAKSEFVPGAIWHDHCTVGILDELSTAPTLIQNQIREMIDGQLNGDPIDPNCLFVATGNPPDPRFVTVNALDEALEKRLKIYIVKPTQDELLQVWERIMPKTIYSFLLMERSYIDALSPREWVGVAKDVADVRSGGGSFEEAIEEAVDELLDHPNIAIKLRKYLKFGDDPYYYPILGKQLLAASKKEMALILALMERWIKDDKRGYVGESKNDLLRALGNLTKDEFDGWDAKRKDRSAVNVVEFIETLAAVKCNDMAKQTLAHSFTTPLVTQVSQKMRQSPAVKQMTDVMQKFEQMKEQLGANA
jgi:MoxR-like ATPase